MKAYTQIWHLEPLSSLEAEERNYREPGNREKINKICLAESDREGKWYVKQEMGHGNQVENRTSAVFDKS